MSQKYKLRPGVQRYHAAGIHLERHDNGVSQRAELDEEEAEPHLDALEPADQTDEDTDEGGD